MKKLVYKLLAVSVCFIILGISGLFSNVSAQIKSLDHLQKDVELAEMLKRIANRSSEGLVKVERPDGSMMVDLQGRFQHVMLSRVDEYGKPLAGCISSLKEANAFFGRNLETGELYPIYNSPVDNRAKQAAQHGMSPEEFTFYKNLVDAYQAQLALNPNSATITIINGDSAGEGFNDPTVVVPEGGNLGVTLGQQRLNVFNAAAAIWGAFLDSSVNIQVNSQFNPLPCSSNSAVLGSAGTTTVIRDFPNAVLVNTWHHQALGNKQAGSDLSPANPDMNATFNSSLNGSPGCLGGSRFYLGLDNASPGGNTNLLIVLLHEMAHGLGFSDFSDGETGELFNGFPDVFTTFMFDRTTMKFWNNMTNAERVASAINNNNVLWDGASIKLASGNLTNGRDAATGRVELFTPNPFQGGSSISHWNTRVFPNALMEPFITFGLPLDLDLTRQLMRDVGWYRDTTGDVVPDTITNVTPSGGTLLIGSQVTVNWTNTGGFNRNVIVELSTNGGATYPTVLASNFSNSGSFTFTVPNTPTNQGKIRVREFNFANPSGESAANFTISSTIAGDPIFDFDGDGKTDVGIFRPNVGEWWYLRSSDGGNRAFQFGASSDKVVAADYTGDDKTDVAIFRPSTGEWFVLRSEDNSFYSFPFGVSTDIPAPADFDGDGKDDPAVFRPSTGTWFIIRSSDGGTTITNFGANGDLPVAADYDGDGNADVAIFRPSDGSWWLNRSSAGVIVTNFGTVTDKAVPADYTGDGKADIAFWRPSTGEWFILRSEDFSFYLVPFGIPEDFPAPGDYDGDGIADLAVFRPSNNTWFILRTTAGFTAVTFGAAGDQPLPNAYVR